MAVRRQAILQEPLLRAPLQSPCLFVFRKCTTRDAQQGWERKGGNGPDVIAENKQSSMERWWRIRDDR